MKKPSTNTSTVNITTPMARWKWIGPWMPFTTYSVSGYARRKVQMADTPKVQYITRRAPIRSDIQPPTTRNRLAGIE